MNRTLVWQLAIRYFRGKRSANAVPILSRISIVAIAIGSAAFIILFSVFNGFEFLIKDNYKAFYPDVRISKAKGKFFSLPEAEIKKISSLAGISCVSAVIEDNVLANNEDEQIVATLKGIDSNYFKVNNIKPYIVAGRDSVSEYPVITGIVGASLANQMGADVNNVFTNIILYYPNTSASNPSLDPASAFQFLKLKPDGLFRIQDDFDSKYVLAPLAAVQNLFKEEGKISSIEISMLPNADAEDLKKQIQQIAGGGYMVETRYEQNKTLYMVMRTEKWAVYAILLLVMLIASFNMVGALSLLVLEKRKDMAILKIMGANPSAIRAIFVLEGMLWSLAGGSIGMILGALICAGQKHFHWIKMQGSWIIDAYPVDMHLADFGLVLVTILFVGIIAAWYPAMRATKAEDPSLKSA